MTPLEFRAWKRRLGLSDRAAADVLGLKLDTVRKYSLRASSPNRHVIPLIVTKLCSELALRLSAYPPSFVPTNTNPTPQNTAPASPKP